MEKVISFKHLLAKKTYAACYPVQEWRLQGLSAHLEPHHQLGTVLEWKPARRQVCVSWWIPGMQAWQVRRELTECCILTDIQTSAEAA